MNILQKIRTYAEDCPERIAVKTGENVLTFRDLWNWSDILADWLLKNEPCTGSPIAVYGHKHPWMLVCFLACVKAGSAYCPIDVSVPVERVRSILEVLPSKVVLTTEELSVEIADKQIVTFEDIRKILKRKCSVLPENLCVSEEQWVTGEDTWYIIFTSGSTGTPKGVQISADNLQNYLDWSVTLGGNPEQKKGQVFLNQAPFSFDLSVMDLYTSLVSGGTLFCLEKSIQSDYQMLMEQLRCSQANVWVSTPSFAQVCLAERSFSQELLPGMRLFLFCGETLPSRTVRKLQERFPQAVIVNTYGPTESTVAVTEVIVTPELAAMNEALPVGRSKPGTWIEIWNEQGNKVPDGEKGEIVILGNTVSTGYFGRPDLTEKAFFEIGNSACEETALENGSKACDKSAQKNAVMRGYHTGDEGWLDNGMLYYSGRLDLQIKLHGYRIELGDIENNLRQLSEIQQAVVLPNLRAGRVSSLTAYLVKQQSTLEEQADSLKPQNAPVDPSGNRIHQESSTESFDEQIVQVPAAKDEAERIRQRLLQLLPEYMIPKKFVFLNQIPMTNNGKADRKRLGGLLK